MNDSSPSSPATPPARSGLLDCVLRRLGSFHIACVCFALIFILTLVGTLYQKDTAHGLYDCQRYYFESWIVPRAGWVWGWLPLPGMALVFAVMSVNILAGGILRIRKSKRTIGVVISHCSIIGFIIAGAVSLWSKTEGHMQVNEKGSNSIVQAVHDWVIEVRELTGGGGSAPEKKDVLFIRDKLYHDCTPENGRSREFQSGAWPFTLTVSGHVRNAEVVPDGEPSLPADAPRAEGYAIRALDVDATNERNVGAARVEVRSSDGKTLAAALSWPGEEAPIVFTAGTRRFSIAMTRERWEVPFTISLDDFRAEYYPGTRKARSYESDIRVKHASGHESKHLISMNEPLRDAGYVAYQTSFDSDAPPGQEKYSVFTVVKNRSDQWPLYSLIVCALGLSFHFLYKLTTFLQRSSRTQTPAA